MNGGHEIQVGEAEASQVGPPRRGIGLDIGEVVFCVVRYAMLSSLVFFCQMGLDASFGVGRLWQIRAQAQCLGSDWTRALCEGFLVLGFPRTGPACVDQTAEVSTQGEVCVN